MARSATALTSAGHLRDHDDPRGERREPEVERWRCGRWGERPRGESGRVRAPGRVGRRSSRRDVRGGRDRCGLGRRHRAGRRDVRAAGGTGAACGGGTGAGRRDVRGGRERCGQRRRLLRERRCHRARIGRRRLERRRPGRRGALRRHRGPQRLRSSLPGGALLELDQIGLAVLAATGDGVDLAPAHRAADGGGHRERLSSTDRTTTVLRDIISCPGQPRSLRSGASRSRMVTRSHVRACPTSRPVGYSRRTDLARSHHAPGTRTGSDGHGRGGGRLRGDGPLRGQSGVRRATDGAGRARPHARHRHRPRAHPADGL